MQLNTKKMTCGRSLLGVPEYRIAQNIGGEKPK